MDRKETSMYFAAAALAVLSGLFYAAGHHELGSIGTDMCRYGSTFCENPVYVLVGAGLAAVWGMFVSVR
jgi:membrane protease YdiL (CAAX protease family)